MPHVLHELATAQPVAGAQTGSAVDFGPEARADNLVSTANLPRGLSARAAYARTAEMLHGSQ